MHHSVNICRYQCYKCTLIILKAKTILWKNTNHSLKVSLIGSCHKFNILPISRNIDEGSVVQIKVIIMTMSIKSIIYSLIEFENIVTTLHNLSSYFSACNRTLSCMLPSWSCSSYWITTMNANNHFAIRNQTILIFQPRFGNIDINAGGSLHCKVLKVTPSTLC